MEDPAPLTLTLEPLDDHLIVEPVDEEVETRTGLIIPQSAEAGCRSGIVTAVGSEAEGIDPGDKVLFPRGAGLASAPHPMAIRATAPGFCSSMPSDA